MALFEKKFCDVCNEKIGLLGNRKLEDGNICSKCNKKLSPFTTDRRRTTLAEIKDHLAYRETNQQEVARFNVARQFGEKTLVLIDAGKGNFIVTPSSRWQNENPDVIGISQVTGFQLDIRENRREIKTTNNEGRTVSYNPPRYEYSYDFYIFINVNSPYFSEIEFQLNRNSAEFRGSMEYNDYERQAYEIQSALNQGGSMPPQPGFGTNAPYPNNAYGNQPGAPYPPNNAYGNQPNAPYPPNNAYGNQPNAPYPPNNAYGNQPNAPYPPNNAYGNQQGAPYPPNNNAYGNQQNAPYPPNNNAYDNQPNAPYPPNNAYDNQQNTSYPLNAGDSQPVAGSMVCPHCHAAVGTGKFCDSCGGAIS